MQAKIPSPKVIWNGFLHVTVKVLNSYEELQKCIAEYSDYYNTERGMWDKGKMVPAEYEKYLAEMDDEAFAKYLASEEKKYLEMKEKAAEKAVQNAREYKAFIEESMEEFK